MAVGAGGAIARSTDGRAWTAVSRGATRDLNDVVVTAGGAGWAVGGDPVNGSVVLHTVDGVHWTAQDPGEGSGLAAVDCADGTFAVAVGGDGVALFTDSGGYTWFEGSSHTTVDLNDVVAPGPAQEWTVGDGEAWAVGGYFGQSRVIVHTANSGLTWQKQTLPSGMSQGSPASTSSTPARAGRWAGTGRSCAPSMAGTSGRRSTPARRPSSRPSTSSTASPAGPWALGRSRTPPTVA